MNNKRLNQYTITDLSSAETYSADPDIQAIARQVGNEYFDSVARGKMGRGEFKRRIQQGEYAELVHRYIGEKLAEQTRKTEMANSLEAEARQFVGNYSPPDGVKLSVDRIENAVWLLIETPWDGYDIGPRLKRKGAWWDRDVNSWRYPAENLRALPRILRNWEKSQQKKRETRQPQKRTVENERKGWSRPQPRVKDTARNRVKVVVGKYQIGDTVPHYGVITGFGRSWVEKERVVPDKYWHGTLYEPCPRCGREPVELETGLCEHCHPQSVSIKTEYCYAYFD